ncbi:MAG: biopolymer transporter ExbD [Phycisphaera sp.]|nr:MAG: biopolymer transporter ExbD [Phycisphaera sp.]
MRFTAGTTAKRKPVRLPLVGMIDVFFLLLVYFIVSTTLAIPEDELSAALRQQSEESASDLQPQFVEVLAQGGSVVFKVGGQQLGSQEDLRELLSQLPKEAGVFLQVDDAAPVWAAASALQACHDAGYEKLTYVTPE